MTENDRQAIAAWSIFLGNKRLAHGGSDAEQRKNIRRNYRAGEVCGLALSGESEIVHAKYGEPLKTMIVRPPIQKSGVRYSDVIGPAGLGGL